MKKLKKFRLQLLPLLLILLFFCLLPATGRQYSLEGIGKVRGDSSYVSVRAPSAQKMREFRDDSDFFYDRERPPITLFQKFKYWLLQRVVDIFYFGAEYHLWKILIYGLVAASVIFIAIKLFKTDFQGLFYRKKNSGVTMSAGLLPEEEHKNFDSLISQYVIEKRFRHAVRVMYARLLHDLGERGLLSLKRDKTNREYLYELKNPDVRKSFAELTRYFNYIWYGNFEIDEDSFLNISTLFLEFPGFEKERVR